MIPPTSIDGTDITGATIDGIDVTEITVDGDTVFTAVPDIPNSAVLNLSASDFTSSSWDSTIGSFSLSNTGNPQKISSVVNGEPVVRYDTDDFSKTTSNVASTEPIILIFTAALDSTGSARFMIDGGSREEIALQDDLDPGFDGFRGGSFTLQTIGTPDTNFHVFALTAENTDDLSLDIDGSFIGSASGSPSTLDGLTVAARGDNLTFNTGGMDFAEITVLENGSTSDKDDEVERQASIYGITI